MELHELMKKHEHSVLSNIVLDSIAGFAFRRCKTQTRRFLASCVVVVCVVTLAILLLALLQLPDVSNHLYPFLLELQRLKYHLQPHEKFADQSAMPESEQY